MQFFHWGKRNESLLYTKGFVRTKKGDLIKWNTLLEWRVVCIIRITITKIKTVFLRDTWHILWPRLTLSVTHLWGARSLRQVRSAALPISLVAGPQEAALWPSVSAAAASRRKGNINIGVTSTHSAGLQTCRTGVGSAAAAAAGRHLRPLFS